MKRLWFVVAVGGTQAVGSSAADVSFDNDVGDFNYFNAANWSDDATVPASSTFSNSTATISNFVISITNNVDLTGNGAVLQLLDGTVFTVVSNATQLGMGAGNAGGTVIVGSNAVLRGQGTISAGTVGRILMNVSGGFGVTTPPSTLELKPGSVLSNFLFQTTASGTGNIGDTFRIVGDGATIRAVRFGASTTLSPSVYLTNTAISTSGGTTFDLKLRRGQTFSWVGTTPTAPTFTADDMLIDDLATQGTSGGRFIVSGGNTNSFHTVRSLAVATATAASGATSSVQVINGARVTMTQYLRAGADNTQDFNDDNGSTVSVYVGSNSVLQMRRYIALGSGASLSGEGEIQIVQELAGPGGFFTFQTNASLFDGRNLTFTMTARFPTTPTNTVWMEVAGKDLGHELTVNDVTNNFYIGTLSILTNFAGTGVRTTNEPTFRLVDLVDNANDGATKDALYVGCLNIQSNAVVDLNGLNLYYFCEPQTFEGVTFLHGMPIFIPEPSAMGLVVVGIGGILTCRRRG